MKTITISVKCSDMFCASLVESGKPAKNYNGYVPSWFPNPKEEHSGKPAKNYNGYVPSWFPNPKEEHYGDYVQLTIDVETGKILNWKEPTVTDLKETFRDAEEIS
jgi:hypothetical protein